EVSRHYAIVKMIGETIMLEDKGFSNGCYVNGKRCSTWALRMGDVITIGSFEIELRRTREGSKLKLDTRRASLMNRLGFYASMAGQLSEVSLGEILQGLEFHERTCTLTISSGSERGQIVLERGRLRGAHYGDDRSLEAVRAMLRLDRGEL